MTIAPSNLASLPVEVPGTRTVRSRDLPGTLVVVLAACSIVVLRLPAIGGQLTQALSLVPFVAACLWMVPRMRRGAVSFNVAGLLGGWVTLMAIALYRGASKGVYSTLPSAIGDAVAFAVAATFAVILLGSARDTDERQKRLKACALAPAVFVTGNVVLSLLHFQPAQQASVALGAKAELLGALGISAARTQFPLSNSINNFGVVAAAALVIITMLWRRGQLSRASYFALLLGCLYALLLSDTRGAIVVAVGIILVSRSAKQFRWTRLIPLSTPVMPFIVVAALLCLGYLSVGNNLSRASGDFATGNGRVEIWKGAADVLRHVDPGQILGYGAGGQISSGASLRYAYVFLGQEDPSLAHTHSLAIQTVLDEGYFGLLILVTLLFTVSSRFVRASAGNGSDAVTCAAMGSGIATLVLCGATEVTPTIISREAMLALLLFAGASTSSSVAPDR